MVMEELYDIVESIADLTVEDVRRHLSNSESSSGDTEENIVAAGDDFPIGQSRQSKLKREENDRNCISSEEGTSSDAWKGFTDIDQKLSDNNEESETLQKVELRKRVVEAEEEAVKAVREASTAVAGMISGSVNGETATKVVLEAAKAVAALATAVDENLEASVVVKEVQARLQDLQALQSAINEQEIETARKKVPKESQTKSKVSRECQEQEISKRKVPKECQTTRPKFSCTTNT